MIRSKRLNLRPLIAADAARIAELGGAWEVASMTGRIPYPYSADAAEQWLLGVALGETALAIEHKGEFIGICGYSPAEEGTAEIGYWLGKTYWGHGFATEAARGLMNYGFMKGGIKRFTCGHFTDNANSARVIAKLGFRPIGLKAGWCEARQQELPVIAYERRRSWAETLRARAS